MLIKDCLQIVYQFAGICEMCGRVSARVAGQCSGKGNWHGICACCGSSHDIQRRVFCDDCWKCHDMRLQCRLYDFPALDKCERAVFRFHACGTGKNTLVDVNGSKVFVGDSKNNALRKTIERWQLPETPIRLVVNSKTVYDELRFPRNPFARKLSHVQYKVELEEGHDPTVVAAHDRLKVYLCCPYAEKESCKALGGVWCPRVRSWYTFKPVRHRFKWLAKKVLLDTKRCEKT